MNASQSLTTSALIFQRHGKHNQARFIRGMASIDHPKLPSFARMVANRATLLELRSAA